ncbi:MAG: hypothetical protein ACJAYN_002268 [Bermanella sp.]
MFLVKTINKKVKEINNCQPGDIPDFVLSSSQPLILKGFANKWPVVIAGKESPLKAADYLRDFYSDIPINVYYGEPETKGRVFYNEKMNGFNFSSSKANLNQVLDKLLAHADDPEPPTMYIGSTEINNWFPGYNEQNNASIDHLDPLTTIWIGNRCKIAAHYDFPNNLACCVVGRRKFTLFPPEQIANLYVGPMEFAPGGQDISLVDFEQPDLVKYPKFEQAMAAAQVAELEAGDALFMPSMWWHHVEGLDAFNVLVTHWWRNSPAFMGRPNNALMLAMLSLRDLPRAQRQAWKAHFDYYIFDHDEQNLDHIPDQAKGVLAKPHDELAARKLRADLLNKLKQ